MTSKRGKIKKVAHELQASVSLMFLPLFDIFCDLLLNRHTAKWNLVVALYNRLTKKFLMVISSVPLYLIDHRYEPIKVCEEFRTLYRS